MLITGRTGSGKTEFLLKMLEEKFYKKFDYIVIICETFYLNKAFINWKYIDDPDVIVLLPEEEGEIEGLYYVNIQ
jgi:nucleoside-triphosphatase THEP1